jgi:tetratricopeptide (TPR) repeat protein
MSREAAIVAAVKFLEDPSTQGAPLGVKMKYLREKFKMPQADIETAMTRVGTAEKKSSAKRDYTAGYLDAYKALDLAAIKQLAATEAAAAPAEAAGSGESKAPAAVAAANRTPAASSVGMQSNKSFIKKKLQVQKVPDFLQKAAAKHQAEGVEQFKAKNYELALEKFQAALKQNPKLTQLLSYTSQCKQKLGQLAASIADAEECVRTEPSFAGGYKQLAAAQQANGDAEAATATLTAGIKAVPAGKAEPLQKMLSAALKK